MKRGRGFSVSPAQREKVKHKGCIVCLHEPSDPAHLFPRSMGGDKEDPRAVVPLCRGCHGLYDMGELDLLIYLEPHWRVELGFAVQHHGLITTLKRVTNNRNILA